MQPLLSSSSREAIGEKQLESSIPAVGPGSLGQLRARVIPDRESRVGVQTMQTNCPRFALVPVQEPDSLASGLELCEKPEAKQ
jgi:hypothetical protein